MVVVVYHVPSSPPGRAVMLTVKALGIPHKVHIVDAARGEHLSKEYVAKNPQHTFPMIDDGDFSIWDSHAINAYLVNVYGNGSSLYPSDPKKRALVDQRLHFESGNLFAHLRRTVSLLRGGLTSVPQEQLVVIRESYNFVEKFLEKGTKYIAGDYITIADFSFVTTLTSLNVLVPELKSDKYPFTAAYLERCKNDIVAYEEINQSGLNDFIAFFKKIKFQFPE